MLENRLFFVELGYKKSRWQRMKNDFPHLYSTSTPTINQELKGTCRFIYTDDLGVSAQSTDFKVVENRLSMALDKLTPYYEANHFRANPTKTQVCTFHLRNREAKRQLQVTWSDTALEHCEHPVYLGVTLDRTLSFKTHIEKTKSKMWSRNNILSKLTGTTWGANPQTLKSTALALCYSAAEYACSVRERSTNKKKINTTLNACCRQITGCLRPTPTDNIYILAGIAHLILEGVLPA